MLLSSLPTHLGFFAPCSNNVGSAANFKVSKATRCASKILKPSATEKKAYYSTGSLTHSGLTFKNSFRLTDSKIRSCVNLQKTVLRKSYYSTKPSEVPSCMKKLPIGIQSISEILTEGYIYADKTGFAHQLIEDGKHYFLSRPRRSGKSLFLDTLSEILKGNKELFKNCKIYGSSYPWQKHPVLSFDFSKIASTTPEDFKVGLEAVLKAMGEAQGIKVSGPSVQFQLETLITALSKQNRVAVLVDEYDHPIINNLKKLEVAEQNRDLMKNFFGTLKSLDKYLRFSFVTGVSKFSQVSLFSGPNNLDDITMDPKYAGMMGYTEEELRHCFAEHIQVIANERSQAGKCVTEEEVLKEIRFWYNGYRFSKEEICVYNPFSTLKFMKAKETMGYWYSTGTPSFLIDQVKKHPESALPLAGVTARGSDLMDISSLDQIDLKALMFQTGYLTIQGYDDLTKRYQLGFPNQEVREAFIDSLIKHFAPVDVGISSKCEEAMKEQDPALFFEHIRVALASFPYQLFIDAKERTYHAILLGMMNGMGFAVEAERSTNIGRIDIVLRTAKTTYIFEIKLDGTAEAALQQVHQKKYFEQYLHKGKEIALIGVNFSSKTRNISEWKGEVLSETGKPVRTLSS